MEDELSEKGKSKRDDRLRRMEAAREQQRKYPSLPKRPRRRASRKSVRKSLICQGHEEEKSTDMKADASATRPYATRPFLRPRALRRIIVSLS